MANKARKTKKLKMLKVSAKIDLKISDRYHAVNALRSCNRFVLGYDIAKTSRKLPNYVPRSLPQIEKVAPQTMETHKLQRTSGFSLN